MHFKVNHFFFLWFRWRADPWSPCSATCGGGSQTRRLRCMEGGDGSSAQVEGRRCRARRPSDTRTCNLLPCARWTSSSWGPVSLPAPQQNYSLCFPVSQFTQRRRLFYSPLLVSRSVRRSERRHAAPPCFLPRHKWDQSPREDVRRTPQVGVAMNTQRRQEAAPHVCLCS